MEYKLKINEIVSSIVTV